MILLSALCLLAGAAFMVITAVGVARLPDFFMRMHAITKSGTLGVGLIFLGAAFHFAELDVTTRALATIAFVLFTAPVSAHLIGRAGYLAGVPLWEGTEMDALKARFDPRRDPTSTSVHVEAPADAAEKPEQADAEEPDL